MKRKNLLIVESGFRNHKEFIVRALSQSCMANLFFANGLDRIIDYRWLDRYGKRAFSFSYLNHSDLTDKIIEYQSRQRIKFDGIVTWVETSAHRVNQAQHELCLPVISLFQDKSVRNKGLTRKRLAQAGVDQVEFDIIRSTKDLAKLEKKQLTFPRVLKPTEMMASLGVNKVWSLKDVARLLPSISKIDFADEDLRSLYGDISSEVILEELLEGPGYSIECVTFNGETQVLGYNRKMTSIFYDIGNILNPSDLSDELKEKIDQKMRSVHRAMAVQFAITHVELRVVAGEPEILEINFRLGGDYIPRMLHQRGKLDLGKVIVGTYTGCEQTILSKALSARKALYLYNQGSCRVTAFDRPKSQVGVQFQAYCKTGNILFTENPEAYCYLGHFLSTDERYSRSSRDNTFLRTQSVLHQGLNRAGSPIVLFQGMKSDFDSVCKIERRSWPRSLAASVRVLEARFSSHPSRFILAFDFKSQTSVGFIYWVPCNWSELSGGKSWDYFNSESVRRRNDKKYPYRYIVSIGVEPDAPIDTGRILLEGCSKLGRQEGVLEFRYGLRVNGFFKAHEKGETIHAYVRSLKRNKIKEPGFSMAINAGGRFVDVLENYYEDPDSLNYGLLMSHKVSKRHK